jgi:hypothetical protein
MRDRIPLPDLLDQGLLIYRRHWTPLLTFSTSVMLPITVIGMLMSAALSRAPWDGFPFGWLLLGTAAIAALLAYLLIGLSRVAWACLWDQPLELWALFVMPPGRLLSLGLFTLVYWLFMTVIGVVLFMVLALGELLVALLLGALIGGSSGAPSAPVLLVFGGALALVALQLWLALLVAPALTLCELQRQLDTVERAQYKLSESLTGASVLTTSAAALMTTALTLSLSAPLLGLRSLFGFGDHLFGTLLLAAAVICAAVLLPLLAVWTALLHQRQRQIVMGDDLDARVRRWMAV